MRIIIRDLRGHSDTLPEKVKIMPGASIEDVLTMLSIEKDAVYYTFLVNGEEKDKEHFLREGDELVILPLLGGG